MYLAKLKAKNQVTIPQAIMKKLKLSQDAIFQVTISNNGVVLMPVNVVPQYSEEELDALHSVVVRDKAKGKQFDAGKEFDAYLKGLA